MSRIGKRRPVVLYQPRDEGAWMPLGLLALGSELCDEHVVLVDGRFDLAPEARVAGLAAEALCLGVSVRSGPPLRDALRVTSAARAANPRLTVLWGGPHATAAPRSCLATGVVEGCVLGAGEEALGAVVDAARQERGLDGIRGVVASEEAAGAALSPPAAERLARASYSLLDLERHFEARGRRRLDYCSSRGAREGAFQPLPVDRVVGELGELAERHHLSEVVFRDEDFFGDPARAEGVATALEQGGVRFRWRASLRLADVQEERLRLLRASGCVRVRLELPEDASSAVTLRERVLDAAAQLHAAGLLARFDFVLGEPGPRLRGLRGTIALARSVSAVDPRFETTLRRTAALPAEGREQPEPLGLEAWIAKAEAPWPDARAERRLRRASFYFAEAQRPPGRRLGQHMLRMLSLLRVRLGYFGLDFERGAVEASCLLRTGRSRSAAGRD